MTQRSACLQADWVTLIGRCRRVDVGEELDLEIGPLRAILLDEVGVRDSHFHVRHGAEPVARCVPYQALLCESGPCRVDELTQILLGIWRGVGCDHIKTVRQKFSGLAGANYSCPDNRNLPYTFV